MSSLKKFFESLKIVGGSTKKVSQLIAFDSFLHIIYFWNPKENRIVVIEGVEPSENESQLFYSKKFQLDLSSSPIFDIDWLDLNASGSYLCLSGPKGVSVVQVENLQLKCETISTKSFNIHEKLYEKNITCLKTRWIPNLDAHLLAVLSSDQNLRIYNILGDCTVPIHQFFLGALSFEESSFGGTIRQCLGESPVSFDIGSTIANDDLEYFTDEPDIFIPIFILMGTGDVYLLPFDPSSKMSMKIEGPLPMYPGSESNYGLDSCDILWIDSKRSDGLPLLSIANSYGVLYNCIVLRNSNDGFSLRVIEAIELELTPISDDKSLKDSDCIQQMGALTLIADKTSSGRFFCHLPTGIHLIDLGWIKDCFSKQSFEYSSLKSSVEFIVCTGIEKAGDISRSGGTAATGVLGLFSWMNLKDISHLMDMSHVFLLLDDGSVISHNSNQQLLKSFEKMELYGYPKVDTQKEPESKPEPFDPDDFINHVHSLLSEKVGSPIFKVTNKDLTEMESGSLISKRIQLLQKDFLRKIQSAESFAAKRIELCSDQQKTQRKNEEKVKYLMETWEDSNENLKSRLYRLIKLQKKHFQRLKVIKNKQLDFLNRSEVGSTGEIMVENLEQIQNSLNTISQQIKMMNKSLDQINRIREKFGSMGDMSHPIHERKFLEKSSKLLNSLVKDVNYLKNNCEVEV